MLQIKSKVKMLDEVTNKAKSARLQWRRVLKPVFVGVSEARKVADDGPGSSNETGADDAPSLPGCPPSTVDESYDFPGQ